MVLTWKNPQRNSFYFISSTYNFWVNSQISLTKWVYKALESTSTKWVYKALEISLRIFKSYSVQQIIKQIKAYKQKTTEICKA